MKRRSFLKQSGQALAVPVLLNGLPVSAIARSSVFSNMNTDSDRVLVLIQMNGGNDGLNMVIPVDQYDGLANVRGNILLPQSSLLSLTDTTALHPAMTGARSLYDQGKLAIVQAAGYPNQDRSHFRSTDIWTSGSPANEFWRTGWLGRYMDTQYPGFPEGYPNAEYPDPFAITMGTVVSETCQGTVANYSMALSNPNSISQLIEGEPGSLPNTPYGDELQFLRIAISQTNAYGEVITEAAGMGSNMATYPDSNLANQLKNVALLISGGLRTRVYVVNIGGFDTHANQVANGDPTTGEHAELLLNLSNAMAAFQADLQALGIEQRVITMTFSEFGRRIRSNDSLGTDHGTAAPLFLFGSCINPQILGESPEISTNVTNDEGVAMQHDFRDLYGSILMDWFEVPEDDVRNLLYANFTHLPVIRNCSVTSTQPDLNADLSVGLELFPNPCREWATIRFNSLQEWGRVSVFDALGAEVAVVSNQRLAEGSHELRFDASRLAPGAYFVRVQLDGRAQTRRLVRL
jgi:uncharacterized protein (DUF1501 family)